MLVIFAVILAIGKSSKKKLKNYRTREKSKKGPALSPNIRILGIFSQFTMEREFPQR